MEPLQEICIKTVLKMKKYIIVANRIPGRYIVEWRHLYKRLYMPVGIIASVVRGEKKSL